MRLNRTPSGRVLGWLAGLFIGSKKGSYDSEIDKKDIIPTSTQKMGVRFTDRIRDVFRGRWIRIR